MKYMSIFCSACLAMLVAGCGSAAKRIDTGTQGITTVGAVDARDWQEVSVKAVNSLLESGVLVRADGRKSIVMVNQVKNNTGTNAPTQILTNKMRQALLSSGKALTSTAVGGAGPEDAATRQVRELENDDLFNQATVQKRGTVISPDFSLSGEIVKQQSNSGRTIEAAFYFHVVLTDLSTGLAVWEDTFDVAKQATSGFFY
ncbi:MAG: penicillin-binding protein activator LpoB [Victivallaceae bacterium]|nr:penicillin-binding protein activator LpoB [Victivallaceae bacterium]